MLFSDLAKQQMEENAVLRQQALAIPCQVVAVLLSEL